MLQNNARRFGGIGMVVVVHVLGVGCSPCISTRMAHTKSQIIEIESMNRAYVPCCLVFSHDETSLWIGGHDDNSAARSKLLALELRKDSRQGSPFWLDGRIRGACVIGTNHLLAVSSITTVAANKKPEIRGRIYAVELGTAKIKTWDLEYSRDITCFANSSDESTVAICCGQDLDLWDIQNKKKIKSFSKLGVTCLWVCYLGDDKLIAAASYDIGNDNGGVRKHELAIWEVGSGKQVARVVAHADFIACITCCNKNNVIFSAGLDKKVVAWKPGRDKLTEMQSFVFESVPLSLSISPDGKLLACGTEDGKIYLINTTTWEMAGINVHLNGKVNCLRFSPSGQLLAASVELVRGGGRIAVIDVRRSKIQCSFEF
jgi:WD40 repeat protein